MITPEIASPTVIGIIVDASASMAENWDNTSGRTLPRIQVIRNALNTQFQRLSAIYNLKQNKNRKVELFCLGIGFRVPQVKFNNHYVGNYNPIAPSKKAKSIEYIELVCDVLALTEIMPSQTELRDIATNLNIRWDGYSKTILTQASTYADVYEYLNTFIKKNLHDSAYDRFLQSWKYKLYITVLQRENYKMNPVFRSLFRLLERYILFWGKSIEVASAAAAKTYFENMIDRTARIFELHRSRYERYITKQLEAFVAKQADTILSSLATGYSINDVVNLFEEKQAFDLAKSIYEYLDRDIRKKITPSWLANKVALWIKKTDIRGNIAFKETDKLTEDCVRKYVWEHLEASIQTVVQDLFTKHFLQQSMVMMPYWLRLASNREVSKTIRDIPSVFPEVHEQSFYSSDYLFGNTPMQDAIDRAAMRLLDKKYKTWTKVLVLITDGYFVNTYPLVASERLKTKGIKIIGCCVAHTDVTKTLVDKPLDSWPNGPKSLFAMSSTINLEDPFEQRLAQLIHDLPQGKRLFLQVNQPEVLEQLIATILTDEELCTTETAVESSAPAL